MALLLGPHLTGADFVSCFSPAVVKCHDQGWFQRVGVQDGSVKVWWWGQLRAHISELQWGVYAECPGDDGF